MQTLERERQQTSSHPPLALSPRVMVMIPTYNERENLPDLVTQILRLPLDVQVLIVDDNSPDGTGTIADDFAAREPRVHVLHRLHERGRASAGLAGFKQALRDPAIDLIVEMDADFSHNPQDIERLVQYAVGAGTSHLPDVVIGSRYVAGGQALNCAPRNVLFSKIINRADHLLFGLPVRDASGGFKCYRRRVLETIDLDDYVASEYAVGLETLVKCYNDGFTLVEIPIVFRNRTRGKSKANLHVLVEYPLTLLRLKLKSWRKPIG